MALKARTIQVSSSAESPLSLPSSLFHPLTFSTFSLWVPVLLGFDLSFLYFCLHKWGIYKYILFPSFSYNGTYTFFLHFPLFTWLNTLNITNGSWRSSSLLLHLPSGPAVFYSASLLCVSIKLFPIFCNVMPPSIALCLSISYFWRCTFRLDSRSWIPEAKSKHIWSCFSYCHILPPKGFYQLAFLPSTYKVPVFTSRTCRRIH